MTKKNAKTKDKQSKNQLLTKEEKALQEMDDETQIKLGLKNAIELYYKKDKDGKKGISFRNLDKPKTREQKNKIMDEFYSAFGVRNLSIVDVLLHHSAMVIKTSNDDFSDNNLNFAHSFLREIKPQNPLEAMLAIQMLGTHTLSCKMLANANLSNQTFEGVSENINRATKLTRTFISQMEALKKHRSKGDQKITVEHINVNDGGKISINEANTQINNRVAELINDKGVG